MTAAHFFLVYMKSSFDMHPAVFNSHDDGHIGLRREQTRKKAEISSLTDSE